jgi:hypothetical protein
LEAQRFDGSDILAQTSLSGPKSGPSREHHEVLPQAHAQL